MDIALPRAKGVWNVVRTVVRVDGMACGICEAHVSDAVRRALPVKKVSASHRKGEAEILSEGPLDERQLREVIGATGYAVVSVSAEPYERKGFSLFRR